MAIVAFATADLHIQERRDRGPWVGCPDVIGDDFYQLKQIANLCVEKNVPLLIAGDITDGPDPTPETIAAFYDILRPIRSIHYILGNHERGRDWLAPLGPSAVRVDKMVTAISLGEGKGSAKVSGLSYVPPDRFANSVKNFPATEIGLFHQTWSELCGGGNVSLTLLPDNQLSVVGDVHVRKAISYSGISVLSPGPLVPQNTSEFETHNPPVVFAVNDDLSVSEVPLVGRKFVALEVGTKDQINSVLSRIASVLPTGDKGPPAIPMVSVKVGPDIDRDRFMSTAKLANSKISIRVSRATKRLRSIRDSSCAADHKVATTRSARQRMVDALSSNLSLGLESRQLAIDLIESEDPSSVLNSHRAIREKKICARSSQ